MNSSSNDNEQDTSSSYSDQPQQSDEALVQNLLDAKASEQYPVLTEEHLHTHRPKLLMPVLLFLATCLSTFWAGITDWQPWQSPNHLRVLIASNGLQGLTYTGCVLAILFAHEMGHFVATRIHRVPATFPFFIPFPFTPIGTMGAVIALDGRRANRREIFDIGLAGPIAGLVVAVPVLLVGVHQLNAEQAVLNEYRHFNAMKFDCPLIVEWMIGWMHPPASQIDVISQHDINAFLMAGWVGLLITGLNMLPISQLDGGHVIYTLFGKKGHWVARGFIIFAVLVIAFGDDYMMWAPMTIIVILLGTDHPPTRDDSIPLGKVRQLIGYSSLIIPLVCFPPKGIIVPPQ